MSEVIDPLGNLTKYRYDLNRNQVAVIGANGLVNTYLYDELNRQIEWVDSIGNSKKMSYDLNGNLKEMLDMRGTKWEYKYEPNNLLKKIDLTGTDSSVYWVEYTYDPAGSIKTIEDSAGSISYNMNGGLYEPDPLNRVHRIERQFDGAAYTTTYQYEKASLITKVKYPEAISRQFDSTWDLFP
ncbi:hypothetical protein ES705_16178 [subsurface metagenome]